MGLILVVSLIGGWSAVCIYFLPDDHEPMTVEEIVAACIWSVS